MQSFKTIYFTLEERLDVEMYFYSAVWNGIDYTASRFTIFLFTNIGMDGVIATVPEFAIVTIVTSKYCFFFNPPVKYYFLGNRNLWVLTGK